MTTNKPEVVAWYFPSSKTTLPVVSFNDRSKRGEPLIRLSDYEALEAECEVLLARVEELEKTMAAIRSASGYRWMNGISDHKLLSDIEKMAENVTQVAELERQYMRRQI